MEKKQSRNNVEKNASETVTLSSEVIFYAGSKITNTDIFIGREEQLSKIKLSVNRGESVNIYGLKRIGKSSLLYYFYKEFKKKEEKKRKEE